MGPVTKIGGIFHTDAVNLHNRLLTWRPVPQQRYVEVIARLRVDQLVGQQSLDGVAATIAVAAVGRRHQTGLTSTRCLALARRSQAACVNCLRFGLLALRYTIFRCDKVPLSSPREIAN